MGYTDHGSLHIALVSSLSQEILLKMGFDQRTAELAGIAGYMHDIGNVINRQGHSQSGALMASGNTAETGYGQPGNRLYLCGDRQS